MRLTKLIMVSALALSFSLVGINANAANNSTKTEKTAAGQVKLEFMYVQTGYQATLKKTKQADVYTLTLNDVAPYVTYFSDKPKRIAGMFTIEDYLQNWQLNNSNIKKDAPNADLVGSYYHGDQQKMANLVIELKNPSYNASSKTMTYTVKILDQNIDQALLTKPITHIELFIDAGWCPGCATDSLGVAY